MIPLNNEYLSKPTVEGDNWMITQQTAAYLIKRMAVAINQLGQKPTESVDSQFAQYLKCRSGNVRFDIFKDEWELVEVFKYRASHLTYQAYQAREVEKKSWTSLMLYLHQLSRAHSESLLVSNFYDAVFVKPLEPLLDTGTTEIMKDLFRLFALFTLNASSAEFLLIEALSIKQLQNVVSRIQELMSRIRPHAVRLADAWSIPDYLLESALGSYDGNVYNNLFRIAHKENPLNRLTFNPDWKTEEIIMGEGAENAKRRLEALALGTTVQDQTSRIRSSL
jgi:acyl-CoA oxidase